MDNSQVELEKLRQELAEVKEKLQVAEQTLQAIQAGEVDALVVSNETGVKIFTLQRADYTYQLLVEQMGEGAATIDGEGLILYSNQRLSDLLHCPLESLIGSNLQTFIAPPDQKTFLSILQQISSEQVITIELSLVSKIKQEEILVQLSLRQYKIDEIIVYSVVITDITQGKIREAAKLNQILNATNAVVISYRIFTDGSWIFDYWSEGCEQLFGYTARELIADQNLWISHIVPEDLAKIRPQIFTDFPEDETHYVEYRFRHRDGTLRWIGSSRIVQWDQVNNCWLGRGISTDITRRKQVEIALEEAQNTIKKQEEQFRLALELTQTGVWDWDLQNDTIQWNSCHYSLLGYEAKDFSASYQAWHDQVHSEDLNITEEKLRQAIANQTIYEAEYRVIYPNGTIHWLLAKGQAIYDQLDQPVRMIGTIIDITDRKQTEILLQESEQKLSLFVKYAPVNVAMFDQNMCYIAVSQRWINTYKLGSLKRVLGQSHYDLLSIPEYWRQLHQQGLAGIPSKCDEDYYILADGSSQWLKWEIQPWQRTTDNVGGILIFVEDISERKQTEIALSQVQESLNIALEAAQMGTWSLDLTRNVSAMRSLRHDQLFGYETAQIEWGQRIARQHIIPEDQDIFDQAFERATKTGILDCEFRVKWSDSSIHWMAARGRFYFDERGNPVTAGGVNFEITQRKQAEIALQEQLKKEQLINNIAQTIRQTLNLDQILQTTVDQVRELLQADRTIILRFQEDETVTIITESVNPNYPAIINSNIYDPCFVEKYVESYRQGLVTTRSDFDADDIKLYYHELMQPFQVSPSLAVPILQENQLWGLLIVDQCANPRQWKQSEIDLIKQLSIQVSIAIQQAELYQKTHHQLLEIKQAQQSLFESEQKLKAVLEYAPVIIYLIDLDNKHLLVNQGYSDLLATSSEQLIGKSIYDVWDQKTADFFAANNLKVIKDNKLLESEETIPLRDGIHTYITLKFPFRNSEGKIIAVGGISTDITEKKQLEKQFYHAQRLESLGTLAGGIAHDFNNILTPILGVSQLLPSHFPNLDEKTERLLTMLSNSARRGADLVKQILLFSRQTEGNWTTLQLGYLLLELIGIFKPTFPKSIMIESEIPTRELWTISGNATQMHQVFMNLTVNARDAMAEGGILTITAENRELDENEAMLNFSAKAGSYVVVTIADTGTGIAPDLLERIFDPFFTTKETGKGTGLGLATVMGILKNHNGFIKVDSELGNGTEFKVFLPALKEEIKLSATEEVIPTGNGELILIVDDETTIQEVTKTTLENYNYRTIVANDGLEALTIYREQQQKIKLIIMDMMMPNLDGVKAIRSLQEINPQVNIIATSGLITNQKLALSANVKTFLGKPYTNKQLFKAVTEIIASQLETINQTPSEKIISDTDSLKEVLSQMPSDWLQEMYQGAYGVDADLMLELVEKIPDEILLLADTLKKLINDFEIDLIMKLIEELDCKDSII
ncbi:PAS domain S-box protein [Geminocystis sp. GBBB08]|uniref:PAS domain S-box protein n=1 Tax=Geminocystis sp. GBBB08 TaxID=2604140 RepID=UPI0027E2DD0E|nr:PAS domain S-box protein [Geminocystis sp. GBBB08]MBL1210305.1 PAS domain S-box protein [Geminocystis sp. GBBB08]